MDEGEQVRLTGMITGRMWLAAAALGVAGAGLIALGLPPQFGATLLTLAILLLPLAVVLTLVWLVRQPATRIPVWLLWIGGVGTGSGLVWLIADPGHVTAMIVFGVGVWLLVAGIMSAALVWVVR